MGTSDAVSGRRDRMWRLVAATLGVAVGVGSAAIAIFVEGANPFESTVPQPRFFARRELLTYDISLRWRSRPVLRSASARLSSRGGVAFPRTDTRGSALCGAVVLVLGSTLLFTRLIAGTLRS